MDSETGDSILEIHAGGWLGSTGSVLYVILIGSGFLLLIATGLYLVLKSRAKGNPRVFHRILGTVLLLPLTASAVTGIALKVGDEWLHLPDSTLAILKSIHQGSWLGKTVRPFYVLLLGIGLLVMIGTGMKLTGLLKKKPAKVFAGD